MLKLKNVSKYYSSNDVVALGLRKVNLEFNRGEFIAVTGESGSGKSTLLNILSGLDTYEDGEMYVEGEETSYFSVEDWENYRKKYIGFVFQSYNIIDSYSVLENVMLALTIQGYTKEERKSRALELIDRVGLTSHVHHKASKLSGGQKQRCVIARALAKDCPIIVADEPTGNLDSESSEKIIGLLKEISEDKLVIVVTHNYDEIKNHATRKIRLFDGEVVEDKKIKKYNKVEKENIIKPYKMSIIDLTKIALRNLYRTPKKSIFTLIISLFIVSTFALSYGSYSTSMQNNSYSWNRYFNNLHESRVIVTKVDGTDFSDTEMTTINNINGVVSTINYDFLLDKDIYVMNDYDWGTYPSYYKLMSGEVLDKFDLYKGRAPANINEIVITRTNEHKIGDMIQVGYNQWPDEIYHESSYVNKEYEIVGFANSTASGENYAYMHKDFFNDQLVINQVLGEFSRYFIIYDDNIINDFRSNSFIIDEDIPDNEVHISARNYLFNQIASILDIDISGIDPYIDDDLSGYQDIFADKDFELLSRTSFEDDKTDIKITGLFTYQDKNGDIKINQKTFDLLNNEKNYQITALIQDTYDSGKVVTALNDLGYNVVYPFGTSQSSQLGLGIIMQIWLSIIMIVLLVIIYFITYMVLKNVQSSKRKDYVIFRSIGATKKDLNLVTIIELISILLIGFVLTFILLNIIGIYVSQINVFMRIYTFKNYLAILGLVVILGLLLGNRFNKRIFGGSVITSLRGE
ncbi:hypothetical protein CI105_03975 [Candidatus Izimaplasma bacterium ZiA1]|uniref:ABC transporter ATP-binding protein n=1 Tax=Candidatus Izimoplasma sp. ZiA1 TaxID=2024899 RepID=UPI000BAA5C8D|nr:hypothetical protein CI105_03975 [Candidatus Izimaplasma bacterium ZiA1]